jgi:hypothetical protein
VAKPATQQSPPPRPTTGPQGREIAGTIGPGTLYPGAGKLVQRSGKPLYVGAMTGQVMGYVKTPSTFDKDKLSVRFQGKFLGIKADGTVLNAFECFLPGRLERPIMAALDIQEGTQFKAPVPFAVELWCEPDPEGSKPTPLGYRYGCYDRVAANPNDPMLALAYESGLIERPANQLTGPAAQGEVDPETGEIRG